MCLAPRAKGSPETQKREVAKCACSHLVGAVKKPPNGVDVCLGWKLRLFPEWSISIYRCLFPTHRDRNNVCVLKLNSECVILKWKGDLNPEGHDCRKKRPMWVAMCKEEVLVPVPTGERPDFTFTSASEQLACWMWSHKLPTPSPPPQSRFSHALFIRSAFYRIKYVCCFFLLGKENIIIMQNKNYKEAKYTRFLTKFIFKAAEWNGRSISALLESSPPNSPKK